MARSPRAPRHPFTPLLALAAFATVAAGCSDSTRSATSSTPATDPATTVAETAAPDTTGPAITTGETTPATAATAGFDLTSTWLLIEKVTSNTGYLSDAAPVLARNYKFACDTTDCAKGTITVGGPGGDSFGDAYEMGFIFDGSTVFAQGSRNAECLDPTTGNATGPTNSTVNTNVELNLDEAAGAFTGTITTTLSTPESAQCRGEEVGFTADLSMTRAASAPESPTPSIFVGSDDVNDGVQRGVLHCDSGCDYLLRMSLDDSTAEGPKLRKQIEFQLSDQGDGTYTGTAHYTVSCLSDADGTFVAADAYDVTHLVRIGWQLTMSGDPILLTIEEIHGEPASTLTPEQQANCTSYERNTTFAGLPLEDAAPALVDWGTPPANSN